MEQDLERSEEKVELSERFVAVVVLNALIIMFDWLLLTIIANQLISISLS